MEAEKLLKMMMMVMTVISENFPKMMDINYHMEK